MESEGAGMKEYIERAAVKDEILSWAVCINHPELLSKEDTMYCIDNVPAADVAEVRHGRLEYAPYNGVYDAKCSNCGYSPGIKFWDSPYCPNCGALMLEDEHEAD